MTGLYLAGIRIKKRPSLFLMIGPRVALSPQDKPQVEMIANPSIFVDLTETFTLGLETNGVIAGGDSSVAMIPQLHAQLGRHIRIQCGGGVEYTHRSWRPLVGLRVVIE